MVFKVKWFVFKIFKELQRPCIHHEYFKYNHFVYSKLQQLNSFNEESYQHTISTHYINTPYQHTKEVFTKNSLYLQI